MSKLRFFLLLFPSNVLILPPPLRHQPLLFTLCETIMLLKLCYYYAMHIITIAFACSQIQNKTVTISIYPFNEYSSFLSLISKEGLIISSRNCTLRKMESDLIFFVTMMLTIILLRNASWWVLGGRLKT